MPFFSESKRLKDIVESHDWLLYEVTPDVWQNEAFKWEELQHTTPPEQFMMGGHYLFVPKPGYKQTLRDSYALTKGLGPSIRLPCPDDHINMDGMGGIIIGDELAYLFSRLIFAPDYLVATSPNIGFPNGPPTLAILYSHVIEKFENFFMITQPIELGLQAPIPMHQDQRN